MKCIIYQVFFIFLIIGCHEPKIYMDDFIRSHIKIQKDSEFVIEGTGQTGYSYELNIEPENIVGTYLPNVVMEDISGKSTDTRSFLGKKTVINKWFIKCIPCIKEMPFLNHIMKKYPNFNYLSISPDAVNEINDFLTTHKFSFPIVPDGKKILKDDFSLVWGYPITIITDESNKVIYARHGDIQIDSNNIYTILEQ